MLGKNGKSPIKGIAIAILIAASYGVLESIFYDFVFVFGLVSGIKINQSYLDSRYYFFDTLFCFFATMIFAAAFHRLYVKRNLAEKIHYKYSMGRVFLIVLGFNGISALWLLFADYSSKYIPFIKKSLNNFSDSWNTSGNTEAYIWIFLSVVLFGPLVEEFIFRGIILNVLEKYFEEMWAIVISSVIFGIWHMEFVQSVYTIFLGMAIALVYKKTNNLKYAIIMHVLNNFMSTLPPFMDNDITNIVINLSAVLCIAPALYLVYRLIDPGNSGKTGLICSDKGGLYGRFPF